MRVFYVNIKKKFNVKTLKNRLGELISVFCTQIPNNTTTNLFSGTKFGNSLTEKLSE